MRIERDMESMEKLRLLITDLSVCDFLSLSDMESRAPSDIVITMANIATETIISTSVKPRAFIKECVILTS